ncbi:MAG: beta-ketoacyl synthase, partial [Gammaproteobacteria bacterium]
MTRLPVIVGFGGVGAAGRSSFHHAYRRTIWDSLDTASRQQTVASLAALMNLARLRDGVLVDASGEPLDAAARAALETRGLAGTLIRRLEGDRFDPDAVPGNVALALRGADGTGNTLTIAARDLPAVLPPGFSVCAQHGDTVTLAIDAGGTLMIET